MPSKKKFDDQLAEIEALRELAPEAAKPALLEALNQRNNLLVAKAAAIAQHYGLTSLAAALAAAFPRFLDNGVKSDPQCWAKNAIAKALAAFEFQDSEIFLAGMRHVQMEPVWGGSSDTAGTLRGTCALALVQCRDLNSHRVLRHLTALFADKELSVRVNAARAVEQVGTDSAALLLRLRAELASDAAELLGACYSGVLGLEGAPAMPWVAQFLAAEDDAAGEAGMAIAQLHTLEAFELLRNTFAKARDAWFKSTVLSAIALTRQQEATDWLLELVGSGDSGSNEALEALCRGVPSETTIERLKAMGRGCP